MANAFSLHLQYAQMIQSMKRVLKACLDMLVIGILYDEGWNPLILNNRLCLSFQAIPNMELRSRAANSWKDYRSNFYTEFVQKWALQGRESPAVENILISLRKQFKGANWDAKVNKLISLSKEKRFRLMAEGRIQEAEALNTALRKTVARITDYGLGDGGLGFESTPVTQVPQPKESKIESQIGEEVFVFAKKSTSCTDYGLGDGNVGFESTPVTQVPLPKEDEIEGQIGEEVFAYAKKFATCKQTERLTDQAKPRPAKKAKRRQSTVAAELNLYEIGSESSRNTDPQVVFVHTRKQPAATRTKREPATIIPSNTSSHFASVMAEPAKGTTESLKRATQMAI